MDAGAPSPAPASFLPFAESDKRMPSGVQQHPPCRIPEREAGDPQAGVNSGECQIGQLFQAKPDS